MPLKNCARFLSQRMTQPLAESHCPLFASQTSLVSDNGVFSVSFSHVRNLRKSNFCVGGWKDVAEKEGMEMERPNDE
jgi:hypothetical protein